MAQWFEVFYISIQDSTLPIEAEVEAEAEAEIEIYTTYTEVEHENSKNPWVVRRWIMIEDQISCEKGHVYI